MINIGELKDFEELVKELDKIERKYYEVEAALVELQGQKDDFAKFIDEKIDKKLAEKDKIVKDFNKLFKLKHVLSTDNTAEDLNAQIFGPGKNNNNNIAA